MLKFLRTLTIAVAVTVMAGRPAPVPAQNAALIPVHVGVLPNDDMIAVLYAQKTGMFAKAGLDVQIDRSSPNGSAIASAVSSGAYDIGKSSITTIFDAYLKGLPFTLIGTAAVYESKAPYVGMMVPKDSPIHSITDFKTGIVGLSFIHDLGQLAILKAIDDAGGSTKDLQFTEIPMSAAAAAVDQGRVISAEASNPPLAAALATGKVRLIPIYNIFGSAWPFSVWFTTKEFASKHADVVKTFARVVAESARYTNAHHDETAPMLAEFSGISLAVIQHMPRVTNGTGVSISAVQTLIDAEAKYGFLARRFSAQEIVDADVATK